MAGLNVQYLDTDTFIVSGGDYTQTFVAGRRVKLNCGINGYAFGTIESAIVSGGDTYVNLTATSDPLSASCVEAWYGIVSQGVDGSVPIHDHSGDEGSGGEVNCCSDDVPATQALRTTQYNYNTGALVPSAAAWGTIQFDTTCLQNAPNVIFHNPSGADGGSRITFLEDGLYHVGFGLTADYDADASTETHLEARVLKNGSIPISASDVHDGNYYSLTGDTSEDSWVHSTFYCNFVAGDYIEVQAKVINLRVVTGFTSTTHDHKISFWASKAQGSRGPQGEAGSGSSINVYTDGSLVQGSPFTTLNFLGASGMASPSISGGVDISIGLSTAAVQLFNATVGGQTITTAAGWTTLDFDTIQVETDDTRIEGDTTNDRITVKEDGLYHVGLFTEMEPANNTECDFRIRVNGVSQQEVAASVRPDDTYDFFHNDYLIELTAGDYVDMQADPVSQNIIFRHSTFYCYRVTSGRDGLDGAQGPQGIPGPSGSGSTINVYSDGVPVSGSPFQILNFQGTTVTPASGGQVDIQSSFFGQDYQYTTSESQSSHTGTSNWQTKVTLTATGLTIGYTYRVNWHMQLSGNKDGQIGPWARANFDSGTIVSMMDASTVKDYADNVNQQQVFSGFYIFTATSTSHTLALQYALAPGQTGNIVYAEKARVDIWRVS